MPGRIARRRGHPWAQAVAVGSWATLVFGFVFWPLVLIGPMSTIRRGSGEMIAAAMTAMFEIQAGQLRSRRRMMPPTRISPG